MKLFEIIKKELVFTRKSLISIFSIILIIGGIVLFNQDLTNIMKYVVAISLLCLYVMYFCVVMIRYYCVKRNRYKNKKGVLFYIQTYGIEKDFDNIKNKLADHYNELSQLIGDDINVIVLSPKNVLAYDSNKVGQKERLLRKSNCVIGVFITAKEKGAAQDKYNITLSLEMVEDKRNIGVDKIMKGYFDALLSIIRKTDVDRNNDLDTLEALGNNLFCCCKFVFGMAKVYLHKNEEAIETLKGVVILTEERYNICNGYNRMIRQCALIVGCLCSQMILSENVRNYGDKGNYNFEQASNCLQILESYTKKIKVDKLLQDNVDQFWQSYYMLLAIHQLLIGNIAASKTAIVELYNKYDNVPFRKRPWAFSNVFLMACETNTSKLQRIQQRYYQLRGITEIDIENVQKFIKQYIKQNPSNVGCQLALFWVTYYRNDLNNETYTVDYYNQLIKSLQDIDRNDIVCTVKDAYAKMK